MNRLLVPLGVLFTMAAVGTTFGSAGAAPVQAVIDFETGMSSGDIISTLRAGQGISGVDAGVVTVYGERQNLSGVNQAMVFDSACGGAAANCTGGDSDLFQPANGNTLIISEDNDASDPDDADVGEFITFDFSGWGPGVVTVVSIDVLDVELDESPGQIVMGGSSVTIPDIGNRNVQTLQIGFTGSVLDVVLNGSGAIDNIVIEFEPVVVGTTLPSTTAPTTTAPTTTGPSTTPAPAPTPPTSTTTTTQAPTTTPAPAPTPPTTTTTTPAATSTPTTLGPTTTPAPSVSAFPPPPTTRLPETGSSAPLTLLFAGLAALCFGTALVQFARRSPETY